MQEEKKRLNITVMGHVHSGKSTLLGHLLYKCGYVEESTMEKNEKQAKLMGKTAYNKFAWIVDKLQVERERGHTINFSVQKLETLNYKVTTINTPGHIKYMKNMITGCSQSDCALIVVSAADREFELNQTPRGPTRTYAILAYCLGIRQFIVAINKMDAALFSYDERRYREIEMELSIFFNSLGVRQNIYFLPMSGLNCENLIEPSDKMLWFKGPCLMEAIKKLTLPTRPIEKPLRVSLLKVYDIKNIDCGTVVLGRILTGVLKTGMVIKFASLDLTSTVESIEMHHQTLPEALPGDIVGIHLKDIPGKLVRRGLVAGDLNIVPPKVVLDFTARFTGMHIEGEIKKNYTAVLDCYSAHVPCKVIGVVNKIDRKTGYILEWSSSTNECTIRSGDHGTVKLVPIQPLCIENYKVFPPLGAFTMRDKNLVAAVGVTQSCNFLDVTMLNL